MVGARGDGAAVSDYETAMREAIARGETASVKVYAPCDCSACRSGRRWFYCENAAHPIVTYMCRAAFVDCPDGPHAEALRQIEADHPGCTFVYLD